MKKNVPTDFTINTLLSKEDLGSPYNNFSMVALNSHDIWVNSLENFFGHFFAVRTCSRMLWRKLIVWLFTIQKKKTI